MPRKHLIAATIGITCGLMVTAAARPQFLRSVDQPIAFNHQLHIEDVALDCVDCHRYVLTGARATIPNIEVCIDCHEEAQTESVEEARLVEYIQAGDPIPWRKVYRLPDHVYFSHRRHTTIGGVDCAVCHGEMSEQRLPVSRPAVRITMNRCMDCHYAEGASNDCVHCHR